MTLPCIIEKDRQGNPKIKVEQDTPTVTIRVYTDDLNLLKEWVDQQLFITDELISN